MNVVSRNFLYLFCPLVCRVVFSSNLERRCSSSIFCQPSPSLKVGLHQGSALSYGLFAMVMDRMTDDIREEAPWTMMFADDIVICSESKERVEEKLYSSGEKRNERQ